jgi:cysteinyl-tRNA synthetase
MSMKYLSNTLDVHCGGVDHIYIHHTNEIAQSEASTGKKFVNYWFHCQFLLVEGKKMSKSLKNYYTLKDILDKGYSWREVRYLFLSSHYRHQLNFTFTGLNGAKASIERISNFLKTIKETEAPIRPKSLSSSLSKAKKDFLKAVNDDINMPKALAVTFKFITTVNKISEAKKLSKDNAKKAIELILWFDNVFGLKLKDFLEEGNELTKEVKDLIEERNKARQKKDFKRSDEIRNELREKYGLIVEDTKEGIRWRRAERS